MSARALRRALRASGLLIVLGVALPAAAKRRHFEPDDLELEDVGTLDFDLQGGPLYGTSDSRSHVLLPDFEIGLGVAPDVEVDVSGAFTLDRMNDRRHVSGDALWIATKLGLFDSRDSDGDTWALGVELGPRFPTLEAAGIGYGALGLVGYTHGSVTWVLNAGTLIDPGERVGARHPSSLVCGLDLNANLDPRGIWSLQSELGTAYYLGPDPHELAFTLGATYAVTPRLDVSLTAFSGFLRHTDHAGLLLGVSPQFGLW